MPTREDPRASGLPMTTEENVPDGDETVAGMSHGAGGDETEIVPPATQAAPELAWSADDDFEANGEDERRYSWGDAAARASVILLIAVAIAISIGLITWLGFWAYGQLRPVPMPPGLEPPSAAPTIPPSAAVTPTATPAPNKPPDDSEYVAMAFSPRALGKPHAIAFGDGATQDAANQLALSYCRSNPGNDDCLLVNGGMYHGCVSLAYDPTTKRSDSGSGPDAVAARSDALARLGIAGAHTATQCSEPPGVLPPPSPRVPEAVAPLPPPPPSTVTVHAAPPPVESTDDEFLAALRRQQIIIQNVPSVLSGARSVCTQFAQGAPRSDVLANVQGRADGATDIGVADFVNDAVAFYCPQYAGR